MLEEYMSPDAISQPETRSNGDAPDTLEVVTRAVNAHLKKAAERQSEADRLKTKADDHRISAGLLLIGLRTRVDAGEAGEDMTWTRYVRDNIDRSERDCRKLMRLAGAPDPEAAL